MSVFRGTIIALMIGFAQGSVSKKFPDDFQFGVGVAAYQIEGAWNVSGKGPSIWDTFTHDHPERTNGSNGDIACNSYNLYKRDVEMVEDLGVNFYRFSLSWSRILPEGTINNVNPDGIRYYNALIDELLLKGIEPFVTMFHWDLPQKLQDLGGWSNPIIVDYFVAYGKLVLRHFGDRVKMWATINEPHIFCFEALGSEGSYAPGLSNPGIADYLCLRHVQLSHAMIWDFYDATLRPIHKGFCASRKSFCHLQNMFHSMSRDFRIRLEPIVCFNVKGQIGITLFSPWVEPESDSEEDVALQQKALQFTMGWQAHPIFSKQGNYPQIMIDTVLNKSLAQGFEKSRLTPFTDEEAAFIRGKSDFYGLNYYFSVIYNKNLSKYPAPSKEDDLGYDYHYDSTWPDGAASWFRSFPPGLRHTLNWIRTQYDNPRVIITENGYPSRTGHKDEKRVHTLQRNLEEVLNAIDDGCNVTGYTFWTLMDNFEWADGYSVRFGLYEVDFESENRTRTPRMSAYVYKEIIKSRVVDTSFVPNVTFVESSASIANRSALFMILIIMVYTIGLFGDNKV